MGIRLSLVTAEEGQQHAQLVQTIDRMNDYSYRHREAFERPDDETAAVAYGKIDQPSIVIICKCYVAYSVLHHTIVD